MKNNFYKLFAAFTLLFAMIIVASSSCRKNKDCKAIITVVDGAGAAVSGVTVYMNPPAGGTLAAQMQSLSTDGSGSATFTFKLPAMLQASVRDTAGNICSTCSGLVKLEEGQTVTIKPLR